MIAIADFGMGNIHSIQKALELYYEDVVFTDDAEIISKADALVIPGDGAFDQAMINLAHEDSHGKSLRNTVQSFKESGKPILGICIGFQIFFRESSEGTLPGLGWFDEKIIRFVGHGDNKVPHMGWNKLLLTPDQNENHHPYLDGLGQDEFVYFIHSYHAELPGSGSDEHVYAVCEYDGVSFPAIVARGNVFATQFHPEKSFTPGLRIIENFCRTVKTGATV